MLTRSRWLVFSVIIVAVLLLTTAYMITPSAHTPDYSLNGQAHNLKLCPTGVEFDELRVSTGASPSDKSVSLSQATTLTTAATPSTLKVAVLSVTEDGVPWVFHEYKNYFAHNRTANAMEAWCLANELSYELVTDSEAIAGSLLTGTAPTYPMVMVGNAPVISAALATALNSYANAGGRVLAWGDTGISDESITEEYTTDANTMALYHFDGDRDDDSGNGNDLDTGVINCTYGTGLLGQTLAGSGESATAETTGTPFAFSETEGLTVDVLMKIDNWTAGTSIIYTWPYVYRIWLSTDWGDETAINFGVKLNDSSTPTQLIANLAPFRTQNDRGMNDTWFRATFQYDPTTRYQTVYFNGQLFARQKLSGASDYNLIDDAHDMRVYPVGMEYDELRVSNISRGMPWSQSSLAVGATMNHQTNDWNVIPSSYYSAWFGLYEQTADPITEDIITRDDLSVAGVSGSARSLLLGPKQLWNITLTTGETILTVNASGGSKLPLLIQNEYGQGEIWWFCGRMPFGTIDNLWFDTLIMNMVKHSFSEHGLPVVSIHHHPFASQSSFGGLTFDMDEFDGYQSAPEDWNWIINLSAEYDIPIYIMGGGKYYSTSGEAEATTDYDNMTQYAITQNAYVGMHYTYTHTSADPDKQSPEGFAANWTGFWTMHDSLVGFHGPDYDTNERFAAPGFGAQTLYASELIDNQGALWSREALFPYITYAFSPRNHPEINLGGAYARSDEHHFWDDEGIGQLIELPSTCIYEGNIDQFYQWSSGESAAANTSVKMAYDRGAFINFYAHRNSSIQEYFDAVLALPNLWVFGNLDEAATWNAALYDMTISGITYSGTTLGFTVTASTAIAGATAKVAIPEGYYVSSVSCNGAPTANWGTYISNPTNGTDFNDGRNLYVWANYSAGTSNRYTVTFTATPTFAPFILSSRQSPLIVFGTGGTVESVTYDFSSSTAIAFTVSVSNPTLTLTYRVAPLDGASGFRAYKDGSYVAAGTGPVMQFSATGGGDFWVEVWYDRQVSSLVILTVDLVALGMVVAVIGGWVMPFARDLKAGKYGSKPDLMMKELIKCTVFIILSVALWVFLKNVAIG